MTDTMKKTLTGLLALVAVALGGTAVLSPETFDLGGTAPVTTDVAPVTTAQ